MGVRGLAGVGGVEGLVGLRDLQGVVGLGGIMEFGAEDVPFFLSRLKSNEPGERLWGITMMTFHVRRLGHVVMYGCMAILVVRIIVAEFHLEKLRASLLALAIVSLVALADEIHQASRPTRSGSLSDVGFDIATAAQALVVYWWLKWIHWLRAEKVEPAPEHPSHS